MHGGSAAAAAALAVTAVDAGDGAIVVTGEAPNGRAPQAALQQALSHASGGSGGSNSAASQAPAASSGSEAGGLSRHVPGLRHITSRLPAGALPRVHLRHAVSRANPFRAVRSLSRHAEDSGASVQTVTFEVRSTGATQYSPPRHQGAAQAHPRRQGQHLACMRSCDMPFCTITLGGNPSAEHTKLRCRTRCW